MTLLMTVLVNALTVLNMHIYLSILASPPQTKPFFFIEYVRFGECCYYLALHLFIVFPFYEYWPPLDFAHNLQQTCAELL